MDLIIACRPALALGGLVSFWALEFLRPFKPTLDPRFSRYGRNLFISGANALILDAMLGAAVVAFAAWLARHRVGFLHLLDLPPWASLAATLVFLDLATYLFHWAYHEVPWMWRLHRTHHSDRDLDVTSASRFHLLEMLLSAAYRLAVMALWGPSFAGVAAFEAALLFFAQFQHSNIRLPGDWDRRLRKVLVTPDMHRVHHSDVPGHTNSNYSTIFSWWDRLMGTYQVEGIDQKEIRIGLREYSRPEDVTLVKVLAMPFGPACGSPP